MKYLKKFYESKETPNELIVKYEEDIIRVLPLYYNNHSVDNLHNVIDELIWEFREVDDLRGEYEFLSEEVVRVLVDELKSSLSTRLINKILDVYYDCLPNVKSIDKNIIKDIEEIFLEYSDMGEVKVNKKSQYNDNRYEVDMKIKDIFFKINFEEVFGRIKDLGFESYCVDGVKNGSTEYVKIEFWKPLTKQE